MPERLPTFESPKCWHSRLTLLFFGGTDRTTHWIWDCPRRSLLHCCHFDPETLPVLEPGGEGEAGTFFTDRSGSRWLLKLCARAVSPRGARRTGVDAMPLLEGTEGCLSMPSVPSVHLSQHYGLVAGSQAGCPGLDNPCLPLWDL